MGMLCQCEFAEGETFRYTAFSVKGFFVSSREWHILWGPQNFKSVIQVMAVDVLFPVASFPSWQMFCVLGFIYLLSRYK